MRIFRTVRDLINSTVNEPEFSLKNFWKRGGSDREIREIITILLIVTLKILLRYIYINDEGIRWLFILSLWTGFLHLFMITFSICSHIKGGKDGWRWIKWNKFTGEICFEKYYPPIYAISSAWPRKWFLNDIFKGKNRKTRWERGLKWKMWYAFLNFLSHSIWAMFILFI